MDRWNGRNAIVTGVGSELSKAIAQLLLDSGVNVVGVDRYETIQPLEGKGKFYFKKCDTFVEDDVWSLFLWIDENIEGVDILINNSSLVERESLLDGKKSTWSDLVNTNILSYALLTREFLRACLDKDIEMGHIINVSNFYGQRVPLDATLSFYTATQHAVLSYNENLRKELELVDSKIRVSAISPRYEPTSSQGLSPKDVANAVAYALNAPFHVMVYDLVLEPLEQFE